MRNLVAVAIFILTSGWPLDLLAQRSSAAHKAVVVRQIGENQSCATNCQSREAYITIPHAVGDMLKGGVGARQVQGTPIDGVPTFPRKTTWIGPDENDLAREYDQFVQANITAYAGVMTTWQAQYGLATATHDLIQRVTHRGVEKRVIVNVLTFDNGGYYYNGARVMANDPAASAQILYIRAVPSVTTPGLPAAWNWAGGGMLYYELRGPTFAPGAGFTTINVGATYDEPFDYSGALYDPDASLKCLVDKALPSCGQPQPDVKGLIGTVDATYAVLDYYRRVKPAGVVYGSGYAAQLAARVTDRVATFACASVNDGTYSQIFRYTMQIENQIDRYLVFPDGRYYFIQTFKDVVTPTEAAVPGSSAITRYGEYPNLATRFLSHKTNLFTDNSAYAPNTVTLSSVTLNQGSCGCTPQPNYTESVPCSSVNSSWSGTFTRSWFFNVASCSYSYSDDTSTCTSPPSCGAQPSQNQTLTCQQAGYAAGWNGSVTQQRDWSTSTCSYGSWYTTGDTCQPATTVALTLSTSGMVFGETLTASGPGFSVDLTSLSEFWPTTVQVPANQSITIAFSPSFNSIFCSGGCVWGIFTTTSNGTCGISDNQVRFPVSCTYSTGSGGSISLYAPECVDASFSLTGTCPLF